MPDRRPLGLAALAKKKAKKPAFGPVVTVSAQGNVATENPAAVESSTASATCPKGTQAVGGGFVAPLSATNKLAIEQSYRSSKRAWTVIANAIEGSGAVTAHAYCRATALKILDVAAAATVPGAPLAAGSATATCPEGTRILAGGFQATRGPAANSLTTTETSAPAGNGWTVQAILNAPPAQTLTAHAYCAAKAKSRTLSATTSASVEEDGSTSATSPACPKPKGKKGKKGKKGERMSAGGFQTPAGSLAGIVPLIAESRLAPGGWLVTAFSNNNGGVLPVTSTAVCL